MIDWCSLLDRAGIQFVERGPNISAGEIGVKCPWCGVSDPSEHLAIDLNGRGYVCRKNRAHRGKSPVRLISKIKHIPYEQAERIVGRRMTTPRFAETSLVKYIKDNPDPVTTKNPLRLYPEFKPMVHERGGLAGSFWYYLRDRGFEHEEILWLVKFYNLHYASTGRFAYRIIIPIYNEYGELYNWQGRTIGKDSKPRYKALPEAEAPSPNKTLLGINKLITGGTALIVCEGPLDAFRISAAGYKEGIYGTCLFGTNMSIEQTTLLRELNKCWDDVYLTLDPDARLRVVGMLMRSGLRIPTLPLPEGVEDPGALTREQAKMWLYSAVQTG